jgi:hypothetical protein
MLLILRYSALAGFAPSAVSLYKIVYSSVVPAQHLLVREPENGDSQWWAVSLVNAVPFAGKKKGADSGIDGLIYFKPDGKTTVKEKVGDQDKLF